MNKKIILASASPRRRELLTQIGLDFDIVVSETEEKITSTEPAKVVEELSAQKAETVWEKLAVSGVCDQEQKSGETTITDIIVHEKRKGDPDDLMEMDSWYYFCDVTENAGERALDDYEKEYDYQVQWMRLDDIIKKNEAVFDVEHIPWVERELMVMKKLRELQ